MWNISSFLAEAPFNQNEQTLLPAQTIQGWKTFANSFDVAYEIPMAFKEVFTSSSKQAEYLWTQENCHFP